MLLGTYYAQNYASIIGGSLHGGLGFPSQNITQTPASQYHPSVLAVLVRYNQAQNLYVPSVGPQMLPIDCHKIKKIYIQLNFLLTV